MNKYLPILERSPLFSGISGPEVESMLHCLEGRTAVYEKNQFILRPGQEIHSLGLLLEGEAYVLQEDFWGNRNILSQVEPGQLFAESFACTPGALLDVAVLASSPCRVLFLHVQRVLTTCPSSCAFHNRVIRNLLSDLAGKNLRFSEKLAHVTQRTTRSKLLSYLSAESRRQNSASFSIPYNRQQLADYLSVDRSALSYELGKMQREGILTFSKNRFTLHSMPG